MFDSISIRAFFRCVSISINLNFTHSQTHRLTDRHLALFTIGDVRTGRDRSGQVRTGQDRLGQVGTGPGRTGPGRTGQERTGLGRTEQDRIGQARKG